MGSGEAAQALATGPVPEMTMQVSLERRFIAL